MLQFPRWKIIMVLGLCFLGIVYAAPNLLSSERLQSLEENENLPGFFPTNSINLGLDLQGGVYMLLGVGVEESLAEGRENLLSSIRSSFIDDSDGETIGYLNPEIIGDAVTFTLRDVNDVEKARDAIRDINGLLDIEITNDVDFAVRLSEAGIEKRRSDIMNQSIETVRRRVDALGTTEPMIQRQGGDRIILQIPGMDDPEHVKEILGRTARMTFHMVNEGADPYGVIPYGSMRLPVHNETATETDELAPRQYEVIYSEVALSGEHLVDAGSVFGQHGDPEVSFEFDAVGARIFGNITSENVDQRFAIVLDNEVISAPVIRSPIRGGRGVITGNFTLKSTNDLALLLRAGALPAPLEVLEERTVGATLGADSINAGKWAAVIGLFLVMAFIWLSYGTFGIFANIALAVNLILIFSLLSILQATLTLPGIAGIVLTIGMAVDANVLIFERIREEQRNGRSPISAVGSGYDRAVTTIIDANITTLIAALFLYALGSGPIKGFSVTLAIGIITSMFTAIMVTRLMVVYWLRAKNPKKLSI